MERVYLSARNMLQGEVSGMKHRRVQKSSFLEDESGQQTQH
jgi:hypothetical protein